MPRDDSDRFEILGPIPSPATALGALSDPVRRWFETTFAEPTAPQRFAWPALAAGKNVLVAAPTGSGKTLAAFLPLIDRLLSDGPALGVRGLYVAPLKALGADVRKNLRLALRGLRAFMPADGPTLRISLRTGDTSPRARRAFRRQPADVLLTTPESLAVLLSQPSAAELFAGLCWVVVDEVHALAVGKRGADLALSLERLENLAGRPLQRVGLSATCAPLGEAAAYLVGAGRRCAIANVPTQSGLELRIEPLDETGGFLQPLLDRLQAELLANRTTIVFTNTRALAEKVAWGLTRRLPAWSETIAVHHSSLAAARRKWVERRLKHGRLRAVMSSTSLELGVDIGTVDGVVLVHPPGGVASLLQRVGRGGHGPGRLRRGLVLTASPAELLQAAVTGASGQSAQIEPLHLPEAPLDVLCQQLLGMATQRPWTADGAFALVRRAQPYYRLTRDDFDACLDYLSGRRRNGESWLPSRLCWFGDEFSIVDEYTARVLRRNLGTILAEEACTVRFADGPAVGEVDEAFADRLRPGDRFLLDGRCLEFRSTGRQEVVVEEVPGRPVVPRWTGEGWPLSRELAERLYVLRVQASEALRDGPLALRRLLRDDYGLGAAAAGALAAYFQRQECASEIPDAGTLLVEVVQDDGGTSYHVHTPLARPGNDALARVAVWRLARERGLAATSVVADLGFAVLFRGARALSREDWHDLLRADGFGADLDGALEDCPSLRERFRRVAYTGLMLLRNPLGGRVHVGGRDWAERRLFDHVRAVDPDFALLRQARREVRSECCDADAAAAFAARLPGLAFRMRWLPQLSPFAESWTQLAPGPTEPVETPAKVLERLHATLVAEGRAG